MHARVREATLESTSAKNCDPKNESACIMECNEKSGAKQGNPSTVQKGEEPTTNSAQGTTTVVLAADTKNVEKLKYI